MSGPRRSPPSSRGGRTAANNAEELISPVPALQANVDIVIAAGRIGARTAGAAGEVGNLDANLHTLTMAVAGGLNWAVHGR